MPPPVPEPNKTAAEPLEPHTSTREHDTSLLLSRLDSLTSSVSDSEVAGQPKTTPILRQRTSDSLTLSSSVSDGEGTSSEGASCSGDQESGKKTAKKGSGGKSKKQAKKLKKSQQKKPSKEKAEKHQKRRAHIIQRIRSDSFNTSSDEENSLAACVIAVETESGGGAVVDTKKVQDDLQRMILSKKPPSYYETPATDPIYHEVCVHVYICVHEVHTHIP